MIRRLHTITIWVLAMLAAPAVLLADSQPRPALPTGTKIDVELITTISSSADRSGDGFMARVEDPVFANGEQIIPAGSTFRGHVTFVKPPGRVRGKAELRLVGDSIITPDGHQFAFKAQLANSTSSSVKVKGNEGTIKGPGKSKKEAAKDAGIGAAAGAGGGVLADGGTGALYGAGVGALAGLIAHLAKHHKDVVLKPGTELTFALTSAGTETKATSSSSSSKSASVPFICTTCQ